MLKLSFFILFFLNACTSIAQSGNYKISLHLKDYPNSHSPSIIVIIGDNGNRALKEIKSQNDIISLDSCITYPQPVHVNLYNECDSATIQQLTRFGVAQKIPVSMSFFITDETSNLMITNDSIILVSPNKIQTRYNEIERVMDERIEEFNKSIGDKLLEDFKNAKTNYEKDSIQKISDALFKINVAGVNLDSTLLEAIKENINNGISFYAMKNYIRTARILDLPIPATSFKDYLEEMPEPLKSYLVWSELKEILSSLSGKESIVGSLAPDFTEIRDTSEKIVSISKFRGKVIFLDFWASWCVPCKAQLPGIKQVYEKVKGNEVVFIGISFDFNKKDWVNEIKDAQLNWVHGMTVKGMEGPTAIKYGVTYIPHNFLIDKNGIVVHENIEIEDLETAIKEILHRK